MSHRNPRLCYRALLSCAAAFLSIALPATAATINVPSNATPTIQSGIDAASPGDTVLVAPGTYFENIDFKGKAIAVTSRQSTALVIPGGADTTIIDGGGKGPAVTFASGEGPSSLLVGFTVRNGGSNNGISIHNDGNRVTAGVLVLNSSPIIRNNTITQNSCYGILIEQSSPAVQNNIISYTNGTPGLWCDYVAIGTGVLVDGALPSNATGNGTPVYPTISGNVIENNTQQTEDASSSGGGGIHVLTGHPYILANVIRNNFSQQSGGGIAVSNYNPTFDTTYIVGNLIYQNSSACGGGGLAFNQNTAAGLDAPVYFIYNNTIVDNTDTNNCQDSQHADGSQVYLWQDSNRFVFVNNIIAGNSGTFSAFYCETMRQQLPQYQLAIFDHNDFYNSQGAAMSGHCLDPTGDFYGNISADPLFKDRANQDYHLTSPSPLIDAGNNAAVYDAGNGSAVYIVNQDLDGNNRQQDVQGIGFPTVDMGVYEYPQTTLPPDAPVLVTMKPDSYTYNVGDLSMFDLTYTLAGNPFSNGLDYIYEDGKFSFGGSINLDGTDRSGHTEVNPGLHSYVAKLPRDDGVDFATSIKIYVLVNNHASAASTTLTSSLNPAGVGQSVTFTATVTAANGTPTGTITFTDGATTLGTQTLANGVASYTTAALAAGAHNILATYTPDSTTFTASTAALTQVVTGLTYASNIVLSSDPNPSPIGYRATFTINSASQDASYIPSPIVLTDTTTNTVLRSMVLDSSGNATYSTTALLAGVHHITATYAGDEIHAAQQVAIDQNVVGTTAFATKLNLASSLNPANAGQSVTFTATVTSSGGVPIGFIGFVDETGTLATPTLVNGVATFTTSNLAAGTHPITAVFDTNPPDEPFSESDATLYQVVNGLTTSTTLTVIPTTAPYGTVISMYAQVSASNTSVTSGTITYMDGSTPLTTIALAPNLIPNFNISTLAVGTHTITAVYSGDATHNASTSPPVTVTITAASTALSLSAAPNPALAIQQVTLTARLAGSAAVNSITFLRNGNSIGTAQTNAQGVATLPISLPAGTYTLSASFAGTTNLAASASAPVVEVVNAVPTTIALFAQPNPGYQNTTETVTANVLAEFNNTVPSGTVTFFDEGAPIATSAIDAAGSATFSTTAFTVGNHILTATLNGSANFLTSTSQPYTLAILLRDFTLTADPTLTLQTEHHESLNLTLASLGNFSDIVALSCGPMPPDAYCTFPSNGPLLAAGSTLPSTVRIDTDAIYNYLSSNDPAARPPTHPRLRSAIAFAVLLPVTLIASIRPRRTLRQTLKLFVSLSLFLVATTFTGCSGHYPGHTPPGTYAITITGQGATTHITHTATVTLIVTE